MRLPVIADAYVRSSRDIGAQVEEADLSAQTGSTRTVPTFAEYIPIVLAAMPDGRTRTHYQTYWNKILAQPGWAQRRLDEPTPADLQRLCEAVRAQRVIRRSDRGGREVVRHVIDVLRRLYKHAEDNRVIDPRDNPAVRLTKPKRTRSNRRALQSDLLAQIVHVAATTGNDPQLDTLLLRLHTETGCRRGGALALRPQDLDSVQSHPWHLDSLAAPHHHDVGRAPATSFSLLICRQWSRQEQQHRVDFRPCRRGY